MKEHRDWRQAERNGPSGTKLRFVRQVLYRVASVKSSEKALQRVRQGLIYGCGESSSCHSVNLADRSVPFPNNCMKI